MVYEKIKEFKKKYPSTIAWRCKAHSSIIERHLNPDEEVLYAFAAQKSESSTEMFHTFAIALTNKRLVLGQKRVFFGYFFLSITPDMFNDLSVDSDIEKKKIIIDTLKEVVTLSNIDKNALPEIETKISEFMMNEKRKYGIKEDTK